MVYEQLDLFTWQAKQAEFELLGQDLKDDSSEKRRDDEEETL